jgi:DNA polymerase III subunit delta'
MIEQKWQLDWPSIGQDRVISFLEKSILADKIAQTYIFAGPRDLGKSSLALAFARNLWKRSLPDSSQKLDISSLNSDLYVLERQIDKRQISVEQAREFGKRLSMSSFFNSYKIGIIKEAHLMTKEAQSSLLKTLEEPRDKVLIVLLSEEPNTLLSTIHSRSQLIYFYPVSSETVYDYLLASLDIKNSQAKEIAAAASGRPLQALQWAENPALYATITEKNQLAFRFIAIDLAERLEILRNVFGEKPELDLVLDWLVEWEVLWRDALLLRYNQNDKLHYPALINSWQEFWQKRQSNNPELDILRALGLIKKSRLYVRGSVSLKNILENLAIYF